PKKQSIIPLLKHLSDDFRAVAANKGVDLKIEMPKVLPALNLDADKMLQALGNLVDNAIKYSLPGKPVLLNLSAAKNDLTITISDKGIGIARDEHQKIFDKFFRSRQALLSHTSGTGLGLYVTKNIIEQHHGKIRFDSEENQGTTFLVSLPIA